MCISVSSPYIKTLHIAICTIKNPYKAKKGPAGMHFHTSDRAFFPLYSLLSFCFTSQISSVLNCVVIYPVRGINQSHQPVKTAFLKSQKTGQCPLISTGGQRYTKIRFIKYDVAFHRSLFHKSAVDTFFKMEQVRCFRDPLRRHPR